MLGWCKFAIHTALCSHRHGPGTAISPCYKTATLRQRSCRFLCQLFSATSEGISISLPSPPETFLLDQPAKASAIFEPLQSTCNTPT